MKWKVELRDIYYQQSATKEQASATPCMWDTLLNKQYNNTIKVVNSVIFYVLGPFEQTVILGCCDCIVWHEVASIV